MVTSEIGCSVIGVTVTRLKIRLCRVDYPGGHQIIVGGRLVSTTDDSGTTPHPDLPAYTPAHFPDNADTPFEGFSKGIRVSVMGPDGMRDIRGFVRASILLFTPHDKEEVKQWIKQQQK